MAIYDSTDDTSVSGPTVTTVNALTTSAPLEASSMTLDEFCYLLANKKINTAMLGGFHYSQTKAGKNKATETEFNSAFIAFSSKPV